jgi:uncharacterized RDD family membrane protein YckC
MIEEKYKTFWPRFLAAIVDSLVFIPLEIADYFIRENYNIINDAAIYFWFILASLAFMIYSVLMHGIYGQTLGKMAMNVKVLDISENKLSMLQALKRDIIPIILTCICIAIVLLQSINYTGTNASSITYNIASYLIEYVGFAWFIAEIVSMLFNDKRRAIHDFIADSVVIKEIQPSNTADR